MIRRIACLMLIPALLANQAAIGSAHVHATASSDQSARAHVHLAGHHHDENHHHHGDSSEPWPAELPVDDTNSSLDSPLEHDRDAVYVGDQDDLQFKTCRLTLAKQVICFAICSLGEAPETARQGYRHRLIRSDHLGRYSCAIYLQTCCLLI